MMIDAVKHLRPVLRAYLFALALACAVSAQTFQAQITGVVRDPSGAVIPNAKVVATNIATRVAYSAESNGQGIYRLLALPPAQYKVSTSLAGFKTSEQGPITLQVNDVVELEVNLQVGDAAEQVQVSGSAEVLQTATATVGQVVNTRAIENLPLNVRDPLALVGLTAGVTFGANFGNGGGQELGRNFFKSDFNVGGGRSGSQELLLDGAANTTPDINRGIINPPVDSVQEFKVQSNSYDAEFGRTSGGVVNVITKSGTNDYHGLVYDFERHSFIEANNWFNNRAGLPNPSFKRHQFGANAGGPIIKNRTFFFADYEGLRQGFPVTFPSTVPTELQKAGDFSKTLASDGTPIVIYDPSTLRTLADGTRQRTPFAGNVIPAGQFDPVARKIASYYPAANQSGDPITGNNNYIRSTGSTINTDKYDVRVDQNFGEATRLFGRYSAQKDVRLVPGPLPQPIGGGRSTTDTYHQVVLDATHIFSPTWIANAQFAFSRALAAQFGLSKGFNFAELGFPANLNALSVDQFIEGSIADIGGISNVSDSFVQYQPRNTWTSRASVSHSHGSHNLKAGVDWRVLNFNEGQNTQPNGNYSFGRTFTQGPNPVQSSRNGGFGFADFLLGMPNSGAIRQLMPISTQGLYYAVFAQDDWRVNDRLTLNLGLRWDLSVGDREKYNRIAYFDSNAPNPLGAQAGLPNLTGLLRWVGGENSRNQQATQWHNLGPRFGFAFKVSKSSVLRGGYGIFFVPRNIQGNGDGAIEAFRDTPMVASIDGGLTNANRLSNPFPQGVLPPLNDRDALANVGAAIQAPVFPYKSGYVQLSSLNYQWEMPGGIVMQAGYWANKGTHLISGAWNINQLPDQYLALGNQLNNQVRNPFQGLIAAGALSGPTISLRQSLLPYPQYSGDSGVQQVFVPAGNSTYHAGTVTAEKRLSENLTFLTSYTWSKAIDDVGGMIDVYNRRLNKAISAFDTPHQFIGSWVYRLPFGKGRMVGSSWNGIANAVLGGWDLDGIVRVQSGQAIAIGGNNLGRSAKIDNPSLARWFDTTAFINTPAFTIQTTGPRSPDVRNDYTRNVDVVMVKNFQPSIADHTLGIQFRAECYNLFNTPQFNSPNGSVTSQSFGQVTSQRNTSRQFQFGLKIKF
jgi:hypothetical protein